MSLIRKEVSSMVEYLEVFNRIVDQWSDTRHGEMRPWCRGHSNAAWSLIPGEYRWVLNPDEIRSEFQLKARALLRDVPQSEWEWYFLMQHYGLPTRLLDWTSGGLLGLYFALRDCPGEHDAAVWILDPWALNQRSIKSPELLLSFERTAGKYLPQLFKSKSELPKLPVAIVPPYNSDRITVQRGTFTVHGSDRRGLEQVFQSRLVKITIRKKHAIPIRRQLRSSGITEFTVFPDLDGLCRDIRAVEVEGC